MISDIRLLSELNDISGNRVREYLEDLRKQAIEQWTSAKTDREATLAQGAKLLIDQIITDVETAADRYEQVREQQGKPRLGGNAY